MFKLLGTALHVVSFAAVAAALLPSPAAAQRCPPVSIHFVVRDADGAPLDDAELRAVTEASPYPQDDAPLHATLWTRDRDYFKATGLVRVLGATSSYVVEQGPDWHAIGTIEREYGAAGTALVEKRDRAR